jgi:hypothetical protein
VNFSLISQEVGGILFIMYRLVQVATKAWLKKHKGDESGGKKQWIRSSQLFRMRLTPKGLSNGPNAKNCHLMQRLS